MQDLLGLDNLELEEKAIKNIEYYEIFYTINVETSFSKRYFSKNNDHVVISISWVFYWYDKVSFGSFIEYFELEIQQHLSRFSIYVN